MADIEETFSSRVHDGSSICAGPVLKAPAIVLEQFGPKGGQRRGTLIKANDGKTFYEAELIWHAWRIQAPFV